MYKLNMLHILLFLVASVRSISVIIGDDDGLNTMLEELVVESYNNNIIMGKDDKQFNENLSDYHFKHFRYIQKYFCYMQHDSKDILSKLVDIYINDLWAIAKYMVRNCPENIYVIGFLVDTEGYSSNEVMSQILIIPYYKQIEADDMIEFKTRYDMLVKALIKKIGIRTVIRVVLDWDYRYMGHSLAYIESLINVSIDDLLGITAARKRFN